ncbi:DUF4190 domain-containing protein [Mycobacterium sp. E2462]|uniref:DUF4190 domain-containing protein n=1 Tax=Mycobacterium sp. E2462 TaxID=1834133 RepID=UPI0009EE4843|nr:DUF4190 domain-containing protein [Mycobacterium sp. E2462]
MTHSSGYQDPFGGDPFGGSAPQSPTFGQSGSVPTASTGFPSQPKQEVNTLATLSAVFAFLFAPAGAALGHVALSQIRQRQQRGRDRAIFGLTASYLIIALAVIGLVVWLVTGDHSGPSNASRTPSATSYAAPPPPRTTVITQPPAQRPTVSVSNLRVGDCIEVQQNKPDPSENADFITIYPVACEVREGVLQVTQLLSTESCKTPTTLWNHDKTVFACIVDFKG